MLRFGSVCELPLRMKLCWSDLDGPPALGASMTSQRRLAALG